MGNSYFQDQASPEYWGDSKSKQPSKGQPNKYKGGEVSHSAEFKEVPMTDYKNPKGK